MESWIPKRNSLAPPLHVSLAAAMKSAIVEGRLEVGARLPPQRSLADQLGLSVHTIGKAYEKLRMQGLVDGQVGRGTYVLAPGNPSRHPYPMERGDRGIIDLSISRPLFDTLHVERMEAALAQLPLKLDHDTYLACRPNVGLKTHRELGVKWLARCGLEATAESIIMTNGVCHGMSMALAAVTRPGDTVVTDGVAHHLIIALCAQLGLRLVGLEFDEEGITPSAFEVACRQQEVKVFFTVPTRANPMVSLMSEERRMQLVVIARKHGVLIIEDDAWGPLVEDRPPPIAALAPDCTIYLTSFTKCTVPGLRTGYLVAPDHLLSTIASRLIVSSWMATPLISELASRWIVDGTADLLTRWQRSELALRYAIVEEVLAGLRWTGDRASLHIWLHLPANWDPDTLVEHARALGVAMAPTQPFLTAQAESVNAVRIALGAVHNTSLFRHGLTRIRNLLHSPPGVLPAPEL